MMFATSQSMGMEGIHERDVCSCAIKAAYMAGIRCEWRGDCARGEGCYRQVS